MKETGEGEKSQVSLKDRAGEKGERRYSKIKRKDE